MPMTAPRCSVPAPRRRHPLPPSIRSGSPLPSAGRSDDPPLHRRGVRRRAWWSNPAVVLQFAFWTMLFRGAGPGARRSVAQPALHPAARLVPVLAAAGHDPPAVAGSATRSPAAALYPLRRRALRWAARRPRRHPRRGDPRWEVLTVVVLLGFIGRDQTVFLAAGASVADRSPSPLFSAGDQVTAAKFRDGDHLVRRRRCRSSTGTSCSWSPPRWPTARCCARPAQGHLWRDAPGMTCDRDDLRRCSPTPGRSSSWSHRWSCCSAAAVGHHGCRRW